MGRVKHVVMVVPVDAEVHEAQQVGEKRRHDRPQGMNSAPVGHVEFKHHDRDEDRDHAVAECLEPALGHG
jgi:hypothetical protein